VLTSSFSRDILLNNKVVMAAHHHLRAATAALRPKAPAHRHTRIS